MIWMTHTDRSRSSCTISLIRSLAASSEPERLGHLPGPPRIKPWLLAGPLLGSWPHLADEVGHEGGAAASSGADVRS